MSKKLKSWVYLDLLFWTLFAALFAACILDVPGIFWRHAGYAALGGFTTTLLGLHYAKREGLIFAAWERIGE